jgi:hypothetical protein
MMMGSSMRNTFSTTTGNWPARMAKETGSRLFTKGRNVARLVRFEVEARRR